MSTSPELATMHTACVRLRDALSRWLDAFDALALAVANEPKQPPTAKPGSGRKLGEVSQYLIAAAGFPSGIDILAAVPVIERCGVLANSSTASARLDKLVDGGHLVRVRVRGQRVRYFASTEHAEAWAASNDGPPPLEARDAPQQLATMVAADAPAVAAALHVLAPRRGNEQRSGSGESRPAPACEAEGNGVPARIRPASEPPRGSVQNTLDAAGSSTGPLHHQAPASRVSPQERAPAAQPPRKPSKWVDAPPSPPPVQRAISPAADVIVPPNVKRTVVEAPKYDTRFGVDQSRPVIGAGFSAEWKRLRGKPEEACGS